jgi:hypothetical protein
VHGSSGNAAGAGAVDVMAVHYLPHGELLHTELVELRTTHMATLIQCVPGAKAWIRIAFFRVDDLAVRETELPMNKQNFPQYSKSSDPHPRTFFICNIIYSYPEVIVRNVAQQTENHFYIKRYTL